MYIARGKEDALVTLNMVPGDSVYGEKRIAVEVSSLERQTLCIPLFIFLLVAQKLFDQE